MTDEGREGKQMGDRAQNQAARAIAGWKIFWACQVDRSSPLTMNFPLTWNLG